MNASGNNQEAENFFFFFYYEKDLYREDQNILKSKLNKFDVAVSLSVYSQYSHMLITLYHHCQGLYKDGKTFYKQYPLFMVDAIEQ